MAEMVGSAILSGAFNVLFDRLVPKEVFEFLLPDEVINFEKLLWELKRLLGSADVLMDDAEEKRIHNKSVEEWLTDLKDVVFKAGEVLDKIETEAVRLKMEGGQSTSPFSTHVKSELEEILSSLKFLLDRKEELGLQAAGTNRSSEVRTRLSESSTPVVDESEFCGREDIKESIIQSLRSAGVGGDKVSVIPVIGAGGLGKTTLVQIIYDHPEVEQLFGKVRAWITISIEFDLPAIIKNIIRQVSDSSQIDGNVDQLKVLQFKLRDALKGKRFLLVLDDVWSENRSKWNTLKSCFKFAESGSKIIVTTRSAKVASIMAPNQQHHFLQELPEKDCLVLFAQTVFGDDEEDPDLQEIGENIVRKCKGNPLSVVTVGGILCGERRPEKWEKILESSLWELLQEGYEDIIPSLWLTYLYLPSEIKPCFAYCSIFPKDYQFKKEEVVQLWMAEGFLQNEARKPGITMEEVGKRYFEELISRSLFQRSNNIYRESFIMHDLVHDLAMNVSGEFCFCLEGEKNLHDLSCKTRYLSCNIAIQDVKIFEGLSKAKRLHSFVGIQPSTPTEVILKVLEELAMEGGCLRVLSLSSVYTIKSLPDSIGDLKHLRYLNLSWTLLEKLPDSVGTLYNLQTLLLSGCSKLTQLLDSIGDLKHLRDLNLSCTAVEKLPDSVGTLYDLQTLLLSDCKDLTQLPDSIGNLKHMRDLNLSRTAVKKLPDSVGTLYDLQTLLLSGCSKLTQLPDSIGNLKQLRDLNLSRTAVEKLPDSVGTLYNLQTLLLSDCSKLTQLPSTIGSLINLHHLDTRGSCLEEMPPHMCNLTKLQSLSNFVVGKRGSSIRDLGALHDLNGELHISGLQNVDDVLKGNLEDKKNLSNLVLQWKVHTDDSRDSRKEKTVLDALQPHAKLKELFIYDYGGRSFPDWLGDSLFSKIERMHLDGCQDCLFLPSLGRLPSLKELKIRGFHKLETIDDEFYGNDSPFKSLEVLHFEDMPEWKRWSVIEVPRLKKLKLKGCPKLVGGLLSCKTLTTLRIDSCPKLEYSGNQCRYPSLESLKIRQSCCYIRRLSLEHLTKLNELELTELHWLVELTWDSSNEVKSLFIEKCPKLEFLGNSRYGSLENLKIEQCEALNSIPLDYFPKLNGLTLRYCQNFESFRFGEEPPLVLESLSFLKLKGLPKFVSFPEGGLPAPNLKDFHIKECENFRALPQQMHRILPSLESLKVNYCGKIKWWPEGGLPSNLESLDIWRCKKLAAQVMHWDLQLTCLKSFWIDGCGEELLDSFPPEGLLPTSLTFLYIHNFRSLETLNIHAFQNLKELCVYFCDELQCLPEESLPNSIKELYIYRCPLLERRYRKETGEGWHKISHIPRVYINREEQHEEQEL